MKRLHSPAASAAALTATAVVALVLLAPTDLRSQETPTDTQSQDIVGTWEISTDTPQGTVTSTLVFAMEDGELEGTIRTTVPSTGRGGGRVGRAGGGGSATARLSTIEVEGDTFSFVVNRAVGGRSFSMTYSGTVEGDEMRGTIQGPRGEPRSFTAKRTDD